MSFKCKRTDFKSHIKICEIEKLVVLFGRLIEKVEEITKGGVWKVRNVWIRSLMTTWRIFLNV